MCTHHRKCLRTHFRVAHANCRNNHFNTTNSPPVLCFRAAFGAKPQRLDVFWGIYIYRNVAFPLAPHAVCAPSLQFFLVLINGSKCHIIDRHCINVVVMCGMLMLQVCIRDGWTSGLLESNGRPWSNGHRFSSKSDGGGEFSQQSLCLDRIVLGRTPAITWFTFFVCCKNAPPPQKITGL